MGISIEEIGRLDEKKTDHYGLLYTSYGLCGRRLHNFSQFYPHSSTMYTHRGTYLRKHVRVYTYTTHAFILPSGYHLKGTSLSFQVKLAKRRNMYLAA